MSKSKKIALGFVGALLILLIGFGAFYYFYFSNPKNVFKTNVNQLYNKIDEFINEDSLINLDNQKIAFDGTMSIDSNMSKTISKYNYNINLGLDLNSKNLYGSLSASNNNSNVIEGNVVVKDSNLFMSIPQLYSKTITSSLSNNFWEELKNTETVSNDDYNYIIKFFKDEFLKNIDAKDFSKSKEKVNINDKDMNLNKMVFKADKARQQEIINNISEAVDKDAKAKKILATILAVEESKVKEQLKDMFISDNLEIDFYVKSFSSSMIKTDIIFDNQDKVEFESYKGITNIKFKDDENKNIVINIKNENNKNIIKYYYDNKEYATITVNDYSKTKLDAEYVVKVNDGVINGNIVVNSTKQSDNKVSYDVTSNASYELNNQKNTINVKGTFNLSDELNIPNIDTTNTIDINSLSDSDMSEMYEKLLTNQFVLDFAQELQS